MADIEILAGESLSLRSIGVLYVSASVRFDSETNINTKPEFVLMLNNQGITGIKDWSLEQQGEVLDVTSFGDEWRKYVSGLLDWKLEVTMFHDEDSSSLVNSIIQTSMDYDTTMVCTIYFTAFVYSVGEVLLKSKKVDCSVEDSVMTTYEFQGTGELEFFLTSADSAVVGDLTFITVDSSSDVTDSIDSVDFTIDEVVDTGESLNITSDYDSLISLEAIIEVT